MKRYFVKLSFKGTNYHGWQAQPNSITVQQVLTEKLSLVIGEQVELTGCGRTDTGVHARNYIAHFDSFNTNLHSDKKLLYRINSILPYDICIHSIYLVKPDSHARYDAISRTYKYYFSLEKNVFENDYTTRLYKIPNLDIIQKASEIIINNQDFTSFSKLHSDTKTNICKVSELTWKTVDKKLVVTITADRFLRNMVRAIVGTLLDVGIKKVTLSEFVRIINAKDRSAAGTSVPAKGLFFTGVKYSFELV